MSGFELLEDVSQLLDKIARYDFFIFFNTAIMLQ